jgi:hypothetical protein
MRLVAPFLLLLGSLACEQEPTAPPKPACELTLDTLSGKTFVMWEAQADGKEVANPQARLKFVKEDGKTLGKYTVKSLGNVYDYTCEKNSDIEFRCTTPAQYARICLSLEVHKEGSCTAETMTKLGFSPTEEEFKKASKDAQEAIAAAKKAEQWDRFKLVNNNLGNQIQGVVFAKIDEKRCRLNIDDMYYVVHDGKRKEDFNPVGTNAFVLDADHDYVFEDCPNGRLLADLTTPELPAKLTDIPPERLHEAGKDVHYFYVGEDSKKAKEGCTYAMDTYANWVKVAGGTVVAPTEDGSLTWKATHAFDAGDSIAVGGGRTGGIFHMVRSQTCEGKTEVIDTVCSVAALKK